MSRIAQAIGATQSPTEGEADGGATDCTTPLLRRRSAAAAIPKRRAADVRHHRVDGIYDGFGLIELHVVAGFDLQVESVVATTPVPEPATLVLTGAGLLFLGLSQRRRNSKPL